MRIKICGITSSNDAATAIKYGATALGFIFYEKSPRCVSIETAKAIIETLPPMVQAIGVFVNATNSTIINTIYYCRLHAAQLHGDETPEDCESIPYTTIKALPIETPNDLQAISPFIGKTKGILLDTKHPDLRGGSGMTFDWSIAHQATQDFDIPIIVAGGLAPDTIKAAHHACPNAFAFDVNSGVEESPRKKDSNKMAALFSAIQSI